MLKPRATNASCIRLPCVLSALLVVMLLPQVTVAQEDLTDEELASFYDDDESVSIATGTNQPLHKAPAVATVITAEQIHRQGALTLDDVLEQVPGLHVGLSFNRLNSLYSIRGIHTDQNPQVLLLINGESIRHPFSSGRPSRFQFPASLIERVEVIRGPGSAVYGADAFAGVINVVTRMPARSNTDEVGARAGSFDSQSGWFSSASSVGEHHFGVAFDYSKGDGDDSRIIERDLQTALDEFEILGTSASEAPAAAATQYETYTAEAKWKYRGWSAELLGWQQHNAGQGAGAFALDKRGSVDVDYARLALQYEQQGPAGWNFQYRVLGSHQKEENLMILLPPGSVAPIGSDGNISPTALRVVSFPDGMIGRPGGEEDYYKAEVVTFYSGYAGHNLRLAIGASNNNFNVSEIKNFGPGVLDNNLALAPAPVDVSDTQYAYTQEVDTEVRYLSYQDVWQIANDWEFTFGLRYDHYSGFGDSLNPRLALVWATDYDLTTKLMYGRAFRAPSNSELYAVNNPSLIGNPELDPEAIDTYELAFDYRPSPALQGKLNLFSYRTHDLIDLVNTIDGFVATNAGKQKGYGFEAEVSYEVMTRLSLAANVAMHSAKKRIEESGVVMSDQEVPDAAGRTATVLADWEFAGGWHLVPQLNWVGDRERPENDTRDAVDDYATVDLSLTADNLAGWLDLSVGVRNLFDEERWEPVSNSPLINPDGAYLLEERNYYAQLRCKF